MLDAIRREQYDKNNFLNTALSIFKKGKVSEGQMANLRGYELNIYCKEYLEKKGYKNIQFEKQISDTSIDVLAEKDGEIHAFECKCCQELKNFKVIKQIKKYKGHYNNVSVFICSDTKVNYEMLKAIKREKANIMRADITREQIITRVKELL
jgi:HJR/Mrr/RecB family endonuclease